MPKKVQAAIPSKERTHDVDFATLYDRWFSSVCRWVRTLGGPSTDIEDIVQEVFLVVERKLADFDGDNIAGWLYRIAERKTSDYRRRSWFRRVFLSKPGGVLDQMEIEGANSGDMLQQKEDQSHFYHLVGKMNAKWRSTFVLFEIAGHSGEEIAALEGISAATVRTHLHRARKEFLALVKKEGV